MVAPVTNCHCHESYYCGVKFMLSHTQSFMSKPTDFELYFELYSKQCVAEGT